MWKDSVVPEGQPLCRRAESPPPSGTGSTLAEPVSPHRPTWFGASARTTGMPAVWTGYALLATVLLGYVVSVVVRDPARVSWPLDNCAVAAFELTASVMCIASALVLPGRRILPIAVGSGLAMWSLGDLALAVECRGGGTPPTPSVADVLYMGFYPLMYVAIVIFMRSHVRKVTAAVWLDGAIGGVGTAAACAAFAFPPTLMGMSMGMPVASTATNAAYPTADMVLICMAVGGSALVVGRRQLQWLLFVCGLAVNVVGDVTNLVQSSFGASHLGAVFDRCAWPISILLISGSLWLRPRLSDPTAVSKPNAFAIPTLGAGCALVVLVMGNLRQSNAVALALATGTLMMVAARLVISLREMRALSLERRDQSITDELTGLGNRRRLKMVLDAFFCDPDVATGRDLAFLFLDLDHFKQINDTFGHSAGDKLLRQLGPRLRAGLRGNDLLIRLGGDEFAVVLIDGDADYAREVAQRLTAQMTSPFMLDKVSATISASIGIAHAPRDATDGATLVRCADVAMYRAKAAGVPFASYHRDLDVMGNRLLLSDELAAAIDRHHLVVHYQPQLDLRDGSIAGIEALIRWPHPRLGLVPPLEFLPLAEEAGLMGAVTAYVLGAALRQCATWRADGHPITVSVNISASNLLDPTFPSTVSALLAEHLLPPQVLVLELTETSVIDQAGHCQRAIQDLAALGLVVSIDDFGAGLTSLAYLSGLDVKELKLDRAFIADLTSGQLGRGPDLVRALVELSHALGMRIVGEGIENRQTLELLREMGCDQAQGFFIGRPVPAHELTLRADVFARGR